MSIMPEGGWEDLSSRAKTGAPQSAPASTPASYTPSSRGPSLKLILPVGLLAAVFLWHIFLSLSLATSHLSVNPLSDVITVPLLEAQPTEITDPIEKAIVEAGMSLIAAPIAEKKLNLYARQRFDLYAWLVPYRVTFGGKPEAAAPSAQFGPRRSSVAQSNQSKAKISDGPWGTKGTVIELSDEEAETMTRLNQQYQMDNLYIENGNPTYIREAGRLRAEMEAIIYPYIKDNPWFDGGWMCASSDGTCKIVVPYSAPQ
jgi:hypothetical protein